MKSIWLAVMLTSGLPVAGQVSDAETVREEVRTLVLDMGGGFKLEWVKAEWYGNPVAEKTLREMLSEPPTAGDNWRNALRVLSVVSAYNPEMLERFVSDLRKFSRDPYHFGSKQVFPAEKEAVEIPAYSFMSKASAFCVLTAAKNSGGSSSSLESLLRDMEYEFSGYWDAENVKWKAEPHYASDRVRVLSLTRKCSLNGYL